VTDAGAAGHAWQWLYPPLQNHANGWLEVGDGHALYWEVSGNPAGVPAVFLHGGPGAGCSPKDRRWFDPSHYRIVLFDQRGAGRSRPPGALHGNTTGNLVSDMEQLRRHLQVDRWLLFGGSWGSTLALAYAQRHPDRVTGLVLRGVFSATSRESQWLFGSAAAHLRPAAWQRLLAAVGCDGPDRLLAAASVQLHCGDAAHESAAAVAWLQWEQALMDGDDAAVAASDDAAGTPAAPVEESRNALATARIGAHFAQHAFFLAENQLLDDAPLLQHIPGVIVQGGRDLVTPPAAAKALHRAWGRSTLHLIGDAGHASSHPEMARQLVAATDSLRETTTMETNHE
jgi:proline iminopeptidase